jgi:hypothetical protein
VRLPAKPRTVTGGRERFISTPISVGVAKSVCRSASIKLSYRVLESSSESGYPLAGRAEFGD